jgi:RND family efflux transporter MFP subunit
MGASSLLDAARQRLELWDVSAEQIEELERTKKPIKAVTLYATRSGFVTARNVYERQKITPETDLYTIADLSTVWAIADIYEFEAPEVRLGQAVTLTMPYLPNQTFRGKITYIYPQLDNATRTLKVRAEFPNPDFALKPDMYVNVELRIDYGRQLSVPVEAVLDSGSEQTVFVALDRGYFEPRNIQLGGKVGDTFIVLRGLKDGERIVTSGNFLIDSESKLKSATSGMGMPGMNHGGGQGGTSKLPATKAPASGKPSPQSTPEDHSRHQSKRRQE